MFVFPLISLSLILRKTKAAYVFSGSKELLSYNPLKEIIHLSFIDGFKLHSRNEKGLNSLVQTIHVFSEDIGIEFEIEKCAMFVIEKGKIVKSVGIELPDGRVIIRHYRKVKFISILKF